MRKKPLPRAPRFLPASELAGMLVSLLVGLSLLAGCGFRLRGSMDLPPSLARVHVAGADRELADLLSAALTRNGARVTSAGAGVTLIDIITSRFMQTTLSVDSQGLATTHSLQYEVEYALEYAPSDGAGEPPQSTQAFTLRRAVNYDPARQLQVESESRFLEAEMRREAVARMLTRLTHL